MIDLRHGDCLEIMQTIATASIDAIICDLPYGVTSCKWDSVIPFDDLWEEYKRIIKPRGAIVLFGSQPFTSALITSNLKWFKYCWTWDKQRGRGHLVAKIRPMQQTEDIAIFGKGRIAYNPITTPTKPRMLREGSRTSIMGGKHDPNYERLTDFHYPKTLLSYPCPNNNGLHPTQKPLELISKALANHDAKIVIEPFCGSGTTLVACEQLGRQCRALELDAGYIAVTLQRFFDATGVEPVLLD